ncbi:hypothetical protein EXU48_20315 [Occultella glacieicola]|uniref:Serine protease n=1 Tax=Occultella glacieicola TaxID=2518684 RepID=A0ABY2DYF2_9MICO|nr:hypothetical protein [Occultella glacieicola]TDE89512.1 hypothetical protein EXU48_20315 [Occultella glacieicola]
MDLNDARALKRQVIASVGDRFASAAGAFATPGLAPFAVGIAPRGGADYGVAVRYDHHDDRVLAVAEDLAAELGPDADVRAVGRVRALTEPTAPTVGEQGRVRPLRPGLSIGHRDVTAGTLGAFVTRPDGDPYVLSNFHVLAGSPQARLGDPVLQPGPADGGRYPQDRIGALAAVVALEAGRAATVDAALASLEDVEFDPTYPAGTLTGTTTVEGDEPVQKIGRTTGVTDGRVSAIELDGIVIDYGEGLGQLTFDDQIEVESTTAGPFSQGGDSGSLVYRPDDAAAVGLLFAGSETGGTNGTGLTYLNQIEAVLTALDASLVRGSR